MSTQTASSELVISQDGIVTMIYDDDMAGLMDEGAATITRMSHVEPDDRGGWSATMNDGVVLGPYPLRAQALAAEVEYLRKHYLKTA